MDYFAGCSTADERKTRYRELARKHHPDIGGDTATMQEINQQYQTRPTTIPASEWKQPTAHDMDELAKTLMRVFSMFFGVDIETLARAEHATKTKQHQRPKRKSHRRSIEARKTRRAKR